MCKHTLCFAEHKTSSRCMLHFVSMERKVHATGVRAVDSVCYCAASTYFAFPFVPRLQHELLHTVQNAQHRFAEIRAYNRWHRQHQCLVVVIRLGSVQFTICNPIRWLQMPIHYVRYMLHFIAFVEHRQRICTAKQCHARSKRMSKQIGRKSK